MDSLDNPLTLPIYLSELKQKIAFAKEEVYALINKHYKSVTSLLSEFAAFDTDFQQIAQQWNEVNRILSHKGENSIYSLLLNTQTEYTSIANKIKQNETLLSLLTTVDDVNKMFSLFDKEIAERHFIQASLAILHISKLLSELHRTLERSIKGLPSIIKLLSKEYETRMSLLESNLHQLFSNSIRVSESEIVISTLSDGISLTKEIFPILQKLNFLDKKLSDVCQRICPLLKRLTEDTSIEIVTSFNTVTQSAHFVMFAADSKQRDGAKYKKNNRDQVATMYKNIILLFEFLKENFGSSVDTDKDEKPPDVCKLLSNYLLPQLTEIIIHNCLAKFIPEQTKELIQYQHIIELTSEFESKLESLGYIQEDARPLSAYAKNVDEHFAHKKRKSLLSRARELMLNEDHNTVEIVEYTERTPIDDHVVSTVVNDIVFDESIWRLPKCRVRITTTKIMELAHEALEEACHSTAAGAENLYSGVRDMFDMFRSVVPIYHKYNFATVPQLALLFHNDCMYLAHHLLTLAHYYKPRLPEPLNQRVTFVDMVPLFRSLGIEYFRSQMKKQEEMVKENLLSAGGLADTQKETRYNAVELSFKKVIHQLTILNKLWKDVMPQEMFNQSLGHIVSIIVDYLISELEKLQDISEKETIALEKLFKMLFHFEALFQLTWTEDRGTNSQTRQIPITVYVPHWSKFKQLTELLGMSLVSIVELWNNDTLHSVGFTKQEIISLIKAIFSDTEIRRERLKELK